MSDPFKHHSPGLNAPAFGAFEIAPDDGTPLSHVTRAVYVGTEGNLTVTMAHGQTVNLTSVQPGMIYPIRCTVVHQTGTTASGIVGLY
ncbi:MULTISPECIES: spike base protein, RCAP_Rcc01079 family [Roseobacter]|uniref:Uncharacterized protein n=1 Tax=Roseobacter litoralis (strain ATCC 49566 / DSM 6996 / JCM 21268 / NBRC 15278 / OCh 149) TaxID=391595 RepID=F7ZK05_ROSLO|nr:MULTISPECIES: hypothetical protein [Roseobacter]AEI92628.1 hypothetical protein RLO149_c006000 [Roseobacter litoralis Och 149]GIT87815.1 hypothetical protein ROBYS_28310 [Roseobacter sp. OBYS 0001]